MTNEEAILRLKEEIDEYTPFADKWNEARLDIESLNMAIKALEQTKWIPVSDRLPEEFESVLVCYKSQGGMAQAVSERFGTHTGYKWSALMGIEPIAWMPLPKPYREECEEV